MIDYNTEITEIRNKIPTATGLVNNAALNAKGTEIEKKTLDTTDFITIPEINRLTRIGFESRIKDIAKSLASKCHVNIALDIKRQK